MMIVPTPGRLFTFCGGAEGPWRVARAVCLSGDPLPLTSHVSVVQQDAPSPASVAWRLRGVTSNDRYVVRDEKIALIDRQQGLGRPTSDRAALIPIRKTATWWALTQDERRTIFEDRSHHIAIGMKALPAVARRLHHCRDLGSDEPFDFLTWFEYAASDESQFDDLVAALRESVEWQFVDRESDIRLASDGAR